MMKRKLSISAVLTNAMLALVAGVSISLATGFNPIVVALFIFAGGTGVQFIDPLVFRGLAMEGLNQEIWTDVLVESFKETEDAGFLNEIPDESRHVATTRGENQVIHLVDVGADPKVLVNNITYPIGFAEQVDGDIPISLDTFVTEATKVTDEEIQYIAYDKIRLVQGKHTNAIMRTKHNKAVHALAPTTSTVTTPVLMATGPINPVTGLKRLTLKDILTHRGQYDVQKIPLAGRQLVITSDHYTDLLFECLEAKKSIDHLSHDETGLLKTMLFGFKTWLYIDMPYFNPDTKAKKSFGSVPSSSDVQGSVSYYALDMFRASGLTKNYTDVPTTQNHAWMYNVRHNYIVLPRKTRAIGAIISSD